MIEQQRRVTVWAIGRRAVAPKGQMTNLIERVFRAGSEMGLLFVLKHLFQALGVLILLAVGYACIVLAFCLSR